MNNRKPDLDTMFAKLRAESTPTPMQHLVEPRASGALFALKQSVSTSLTSAKVLWIGMTIALATAGGILFTANTADRHERDITVAAQQAPVVPAEARTQSPVLQHRADSAPEEISPAVPVQSSATTGHGRTTGTAALHTGVQAKPFTTGISRPSAIADDKTPPQTAESTGITAAQYLGDSPGHLNIEYFDMSLLPPPVEEFPLPEDNADNSRSVSLTMNGMALLADIVQAQAEFQIGRNMSCALLLGVGNVGSRSADTSHRLLLAGAQVNYYLLGNFDEGLQIGAQALFSSTSFEANNTFFYENGRVLSILPYAGYKLIMASGLSFNLQAGVGAATPVFIPEPAGTGSNTEYRWHVSTRIHMNIGWSF